MMKAPGYYIEKRILVWFHQLSIEFVMKQLILTHSLPILMYHKWVVRSTCELIAEQRFIYGGRALTRFLHALCSEGDYIQASCSASRYWDESEGRSIPTRLGTSA